jgi:flagellin-like protein
MKLLRKLSRRAISPLIATIILIAICVVGGLMVYSIFMSTSSTMSARGQISMEAVDLVKNTAGDATFSITLKNTGNKPAVSLKVTLQGQSAVSLKVAGADISNSNPLQPGQSATLLVNPVSQASYTYIVGNSYNVVIEAQFSDGSVFTKTEAVTCRYG